MEDAVEDVKPSWSTTLTTSITLLAADCVEIKRERSGENLVRKGWRDGERSQGASWSLWKASTESQQGLDKGEGKRKAGTGVHHTCK